jgi:hypothetical protein
LYPSQFLGICPFLGVSKKTETALGMGIAVIFVIGVASVVTYALNLLLIAAKIEYMQTIVFILVVAGLIQILEIVLKKFTPALYSALGVYLPLTQTNCAVLGSHSDVTSLARPSHFYAFSTRLRVAPLYRSNPHLASLRKNADFGYPEPFKGFRNPDYSFADGNEFAACTAFHFRRSNGFLIPC